MADYQLSVELRAEIQRYVSGLREASNETRRTESNVSKSSNAISGAIAGAFSIGAVISFGKEVLNATAEYQKFQAVLSNTLGSRALADLKLKEIQDFAAKTPFGVNELTGAFVKLANAGFKPTGNEMTKLGDLASSTGKSFDQLAEAILDAQSGEFERLKEFGVRAKDAGDKVVFTYKGVQTQVDKTAGSIRNYITSLGDAEGVSGSMAAVSATLGGQISNLGDSWDQMLLSVGGNTEGVFSGSISIISLAINKVTEFNKQLEIAGKYKIGNTFTRILEGLKSLTPGGAGPSENEVKILGIQTANESVSKFVSNAIAGAKSAKDFGEALKSLKERGDKDLKNIKDPKLAKGIKDAYQNGVKAIQDARSNLLNTATADANFGTGKKGKTVKGVSDILKALNEDLSKTELGFKATFDDINEGKIKSYQRAIEDLSKVTGQDAVNAIQKLRDAQNSLFQLGGNKSLQGSVNQGLSEQKNSLGQTGLNGIEVKDDSLNKFKSDLDKKSKIVTDNQQFILNNTRSFNTAFAELSDLSLISEGIGSAFEGIGSSLAAGASIVEAAGQGIQKAFSGVISALGDQFIQLGVAKIAAAALLTPFGAAMAAQGAGLVALGAGLKIGGGLVGGLGGGSKSSSGSNVTAFANGGVVYGPTNALIGEYAGAKSDPEVVAPLSKLKDMIGKGTADNPKSDTNVVLSGELKANGKDLVALIRKVNEFNGRIG